MTIRLISCRACGHMMRLGSSRCGQCGNPAPASNWTVTHIGAVVLLVVVAGAGLVTLLN